MNILEKQKAIQRVENEQLLYLKKCMNVAKLPEAKRTSTVINRALKVVSYTMKVRQLELQKNIIASTPIFDGNKDIKYPSVMWILSLWRRNVSFIVELGRKIKKIIMKK